MNDQNCRSVGKYGLSFTNGQISSGGIPETEPSPCLVEYLQWLLLFGQRPDNQRSGNVGKRGLFSTDEENLSGSVQERKLLSC